MAGKCKKFPNQPHDLNKFDYPDPVPAAAGKDLTNNTAPTPTLPEYLYNVPGKAGGGKFKPVSGRTAAEAIVNGWTTLQHKRGVITNLTQIRWNKNHPTNKFLIRLSVPDPDNEGQTKEDETVWAPSSVFVHAQCDAATLATIMEMDPHEWRAFGTGKKAPRNSIQRRKAARVAFGFNARREAQLLGPQRLGGDCILAAIVSHWRSHCAYFLSLTFCVLLARPSCSTPCCHRSRRGCWKGPGRHWGARRNLREGSMPSAPW